MGRRAGLPSIYRRGETYWCRYTVAGKRYLVSTGERDPDRAREAAGKLHAQATLSLRPVERAPAGPPGVEGLGPLFARYFEYAESQGLDEEYIKSQRLHFKVHFRPRWSHLYQITAAAIASYQSERTAGTEKRDPVGTVTLYKELVTLSQFLKWAKRDGKIAAVPEFERPTKVTSYTVPFLTADDVRLLLAELPDRAAHPKRYPVREFATWLWSMALRFSEGASILWSDVNLRTDCLTVRAEIDKAGKEWVLPLTDEARALLTAEARRPHKASDPIFDLSSVRASFNLATERLRGKKASASYPHVTPHHLRHARISEWANSTRRLAAVQFMARHTSIATTALYVRSRTEAARSMLDEIRDSDTRGPGILIRRPRRRGAR